MKLFNRHILLAVCILLLGFSANNVQAAFIPNQTVTLTPGWNIVSTPRVLSSHEFSASETLDNFDVYVLDASKPTGWATMADIGQTEFQPLYGYFIDNKTGVNQTLTFVYANNIGPNEKIFERAFPTEGWYSIGVANAEYSKDINANRDDEDNPSKILSLLAGKYDLVIDFTDSAYALDKKSVALSDPWKAVIPEDIDTLNDLRDTKGYAIYIKEADARYNGFQSEATTTPSISKLAVATSSENPSATTFALDPISTSDWMTVMAYDLDTTGSDNDITLTTLPVGVIVSSSTFNHFVSDARLIVNGVTYTDWSLEGADGDHVQLDFNINNNALIDGGSRVTAKLQLKFKELANGDEGATIFATSTAAAIVAEGDSEMLSTANNELVGSVVGGVHVLRTAGPILDNFSSSQSQTVDPNSSSANTGNFTLKFDVTALGSDLYIAKTATPGDSATSGVLFAVQDNAGINVSSGTTSASLSSAASTDSTSNKFVVHEGETKTFTVSVTYDPATAGYYQVQLKTLNAASTNTDSVDIHQNALPASDYISGQVYVAN